MKAVRRRAAGAQILMTEHVEQLWLTGYKCACPFAGSHQCCRDAAEPDNTYLQHPLSTCLTTLIHSSRRLTHGLLFIAPNIVHALPPTPLTVRTGR